jgi:hypothetical protein
VVDVFNDFDHEDGANLLASFRDRAEAMRRTIDAATPTTSEDAGRAMHRVWSATPGMQMRATYSNRCFRTLTRRSC